MEINELKRKLRSLKKQEIHLRFSYNQEHSPSDLVWSEFFDCKQGNCSKVKYSLNFLMNASREERKKAFDMFTVCLYMKYYQENGYTNVKLYDPKLLKILELDFTANMDDIKKSFRKSVMQSHPDHGGDILKFLEIHEAYEKLKK